MPVLLSMHASMPARRLGPAIGPDSCFGVLNPNPKNPKTAFQQETTSFGVPGAQGTQLQNWLSACRTVLCTLRYVLYPRDCGTHDARLQG